MKLGIDYTPQGLLARYCIQCPAPSGQVGDFVFIGETHKSGTPISPVFDDVAQLDRWMASNGWERVRGGDGFNLRKI